MTICGFIITKFEAADLFYDNILSKKFTQVFKLFQLFCWLLKPFSPRGRIFKYIGQPVFELNSAYERIKLFKADL